jgi:hypothetical protein
MAKGLTTEMESLSIINDIIYATALTPRIKGIRVPIAIIQVDIKVFRGAKRVNAGRSA